jgi:hypothetical protein
MSQPLNERRRRERMTLRCPIEIVISGEVAPRRAITCNISSNGVYCLTSTSFAHGQRLPCQIEITPQSSAYGLAAVYLDCILEVVRVERTVNGYGIGCRIIRYVLRRSANPATRWDNQTVAVTAARM